MKTHFILHPVPPFRLDLTVWILRRRPENIVDAWDGEVYRRALVMDGVPVLIEARQEGGMETPALQTAVEGPASRGFLKKKASAALERILGLGLDLSAFYAMAESRPEIRALAARFRGAKPPRFPTVFEALINGIACQQLSLAVGITLMNRLAGRFGTDVAGYPAFPHPRDLAGKKEEAFRKMGYSLAKARAVIGAAAEIARDRFNPDALYRMENAGEIASRLDALPGVGPWTADYVLLRGLGRLEIFPGADVGARRNLSRIMHPEQPLTFEEIASLVSRWHPFGGFIYFHLLLNGLSERGLIA